MARKKTKGTKATKAAKRKTTKAAKKPRKAASSKAPVESSRATDLLRGWSPSRYSTR